MKPSRNIDSMFSKKLGSGHYKSDETRQSVPPQADLQAGIPG